jgi:hypothetical protein
MNYKLILLLLVSLFIGANLMCSCCRYPVFDYLMGRSVKEGVETRRDKPRDVGTPGSTQSVDTASSDVVAMVNEQRPLPDVVAATVAADKKEGFDMNQLFMTGLNKVTGVTEGVTGRVPPAPREEAIPVKKDGREGMALMGSDINEVQNGDVAGMWVTKANTYASEFGYGIMNNTGSAYTADEPLKNGAMVMFAKNKFKPECCPAPYSSSTGCVCMTPEQINYLNTRGGNRTSDSGV